GPFAEGETLQTTEGSPINGLVARFSDASPDAASRVYTVSIDWNDGETSATTLTPASGTGNYTINAGHTYTTSGTYQPTITVSDQDGILVSAQGQVVVLDAALSATGLNVVATPGTPFTGAVATFTDADPNAVAGLFTATINWGDGQVSQGTVTGSAG